jgi:drug/metabolite transporter (DMT)-like permease
MSALWLLFASITVIGSTMYNVAIKSAGESVNPFIFTLLLTAFAFAGHAIILAANKFFFDPSLKLSISTSGLGWAFMAGMGVVLIDLFFFLGVRQGGLTMTNAFWTIASFALVVLIGLLFFNETINAVKAIGLALGVVSLFLITRP